jgi:uncharacterized membrane protein
MMIIQLPMAVMFYKVHTSNFFASSNLTELGSCEALGTILLSTDQAISLFYVFLLKDTLFNIYCLFTHTTLMANSTVAHP